MANRVVPMPSFTDPHLPEAAGGSINFGVANNFPEFRDHPVQHSADYGGALSADSFHVDPVEGDVGRDDWTKAMWIDKAEAYGLPTRGTKDELKEAVEAHEAQLEAERSDN